MGKEDEEKEKGRAMGVYVWGLAFMQRETQWESRRREKAKKSREEERRAGFELESRDGEKSK